MSAYNDIDAICQKLEIALKELHRYVFRGGRVEEVDIEYLDLIQDSFFDQRFYRCETIQEAYFKLRILTVGLNKYWDYDKILNEKEL